MTSGTSVTEKATSTSNANLKQGSVRKPPSWLDNYDTYSEELNPDKNMMNQAIFGPYVNKDLVNYEYTTKVDMWKS